MILAPPAGSPSPSAPASVIHAPDWDELIGVIDLALGDSPAARTAVCDALIQFKTSRPRAAAPQ
jgi:hypothetical protein